MIKVAICDDIRSERQNIETELNRYLNEHGLQDQFEFESFSDPKVMIRRCSVVDFDLFLLDVLMPQVTGIETAKELQEMLPDAQFVFITTTSEFVMDAISLKALYYLLKPFTSEDFDEAMNRVKNHFIGEEKVSALLTDAENETLRIYVGDVVYAQRTGRGKNIKLVMKDQDYELTDYSLEELKELFKLNSFVVAGDRLFNIENIRHISDRTVIMRNGEKLAVSKDVYRDIRREFIDFYER